MIAIDIDNIRNELSKICVCYEKSAPAVSQWADDLYMRLQDNPRDILLGELLIINHLHNNNEGFIHPNFAQNTVYHLLNNLRLDTTGWIDH